MNAVINEAVTKAEQLKSLYPNAISANEIIELAWNDGHFKDKNFALAVWGRLNRLFR